MNELEKEIAGVTEMLAFVLHQVGENVVVPKDLMKTGLPTGAQVAIIDDGDNFVFGLEYSE